MPAYLISYDLRKQKNYEQLYEAIRSYGTWARINESVWAVVSSKTTVQVRDHLRMHIDGDDRLFVMRSSGDAAWVNAMCKVEWLQEYLP